MQYSVSGLFQPGLRAFSATGLGDNWLNGTILPLLWDGHWAEVP
jgi:hypothetical protein